MAKCPQQLTIYLYSAHRAVIFAIAQLSCYFFKINTVAVSKLVCTNLIYVEPGVKSDAVY